MYLDCNLVKVTKVTVKAAKGRWFGSWATCLSVLERDTFTYSCFLCAYVTLEKNIFQM